MIADPARGKRICFRWRLAALAALVSAISLSVAAQPPNVKPVSVNSTRKPEAASPPSAKDDASLDEQASGGTLPSAGDLPVLDGPALQEGAKWSEIARALLLTAIPDKYEDTKHWGKTRRVFDGLDVRQRGFNIRAVERKKYVNHGAWYKYAVQFPHPEKNLTVLIDQIQSISPGRFTFAIHLALKNIQVTTQFENWVLGVKGLNFDIVSDVEIHLHAVCEVAIQLKPQPKSLLPDLILNPTIHSIQLKLADLETHRIGRIGGDIAEELGNGSRQFIQELMHSQEGRVLKKANEAIQNKRESLRLPASKLW